MRFSEAWSLCSGGREVRPDRAAVREKIFLSGSNRGGEEGEK